MLHLHICPHCVAQTVEIVAPYAGSWISRFRLWWKVKFG
jgi:hypothetical protein